MTYEELVSEFGKQVADLVRELTDAPASAGSREERKVLDLARIVAASADAQSIKCADLISNTSTIARRSGFREGVPTGKTGGSYGARSRRSYDAIAGVEVAAGSRVVAWYLGNWHGVVARSGRHRRDRPAGIGRNWRESKESNPD